MQVMIEKTHRQISELQSANENSMEIETGIWENEILAS